MNMRAMVVADLDNKNVLRKVVHHFLEVNRPGFCIFKRARNQ